jgi:predicted DNA-binding WGR domain protein
MPRYERHVGDEHRFFEIRLLPSAYFYRWGRIGEQPKEETQTFPTPEAAKAAYTDVINRNYGQYQLVPRQPKGPSGATPVREGVLAQVIPGFFKAAASPPKELVTKLLEQPESPDFWRQAADEFEKLGAKLAGRGTPPLEENSEVIWGSDLVECLKIKTLIPTWRSGFVHSLFVGNNSFSDFEPGDVLAAALTVPACQLLREIALGVADVGRQDLGTSVKVLCERKLETVNRISLLDDLELDELSWIATVGDLGKLWRALPNLEHVRIRTGSEAKLGKLDVPRAKSFVMETCGLTAKNFTAITSAAWPQLEKLDVMFGGTDEKSGGTCSADHLATLLSRKDMPKLSWLGLRDAEFTDDLVPLIARSVLLPQLKTLDLSMGCLTDKGAQEILNHRTAFAHLESLNLEQNVLSAEMTKTLAKMGQYVRLDRQRLEHFDEGDRPSVVIWGNTP